MVAEYARRFFCGRWSFLELGSEEKWYGSYTDKPDGSWDRMAQNMMTNFSEFGHPILHASSAFERGELRSNAHGKKNIHFSGGEENIDLFLRMVISANQLSVCGAVADLCIELSEDFRASGKLEASDHLETMEMLTGPSIAGTRTCAQQHGNVVQGDERKFEQ